MRCRTWWLAISSPTRSRVSLTSTLITWVLITSPAVVFMVSVWPALTQRITMSRSVITPSTLPASVIGTKPQS